MKNPRSAWSILQNVSRSDSIWSVPHARVIKECWLWRASFVAAAPALPAMHSTYFRNSRLRSLGLLRWGATIPTTLKLLCIRHQPHPFQFLDTFDHDRSRSLPFKYLAANLHILADERNQAGALILVRHNL